MTNYVEWFRSQLKSSGEGFVWAFRQIDPALHLSLPPNPHYLGTWPPARLVWHVTEYERCVALPSMRHFLGGPMLTEDAWPDSDDLWAIAQQQTAEELIAAFQAVRDEQIQLLNDLQTIDWTAPGETVWGMKPLALVVTKTYQHTFEHGDTLLRMGMWWEHFERDMAEKAT